MMTGSIGRLLRFAAVLALAGFTVGCASSQQTGPRATAPAGYGGDPESRAERLVQYCDRLVEKGELVTALGLCARAHEVNPDDPETLMKVAAILKKMNRREAAAQTYGTLLERHPGHQEARYSLGKLYMESGETALASIEFDHAMRSNPEDPRAYNALGILRDQEGEHEAAQGLYRLALERDPGNMSVRNNLGLSLALDGKRDEAIDLLAELAVDPTASQTTLRNLEAAYAARVVPADKPGSAPLNEPLAEPAAEPAAAPAAVPAATPATTPVKAMSVPADSNPLHEPVESRPMEAPGKMPREVTTPSRSPVRIPMVKGPKQEPKTPEAGKPTPLFIPPAAKSDGQRPQQSGQRRIRSTLSAPNLVVASPSSSVILAAAERLMEPPAWADFEPGALIDDTPVPLAPAAQPRNGSPAAQPQNGEIGEISVDTMDLTMLELHEKRPAPYALSMLMVEDGANNV
jgi:Flp pilus assembly protein TadD